MPTKDMMIIIDDALSSLDEEACQRTQFPPKDHHVYERKWRPLLEAADKSKEALVKAVTALELKACNWDMLVKELKLCGGLALAYDKETDRYDINHLDNIDYLLEEPLDNLEDAVEHHADYCGVEREEEDETNFESTK